MKQLRTLLVEGRDSLHIIHRAKSPTTNAVPTTATPVKKSLDEHAAEVPSVDSVSAASDPLAAGSEAPVSVADGMT